MSLLSKEKIFLKSSVYSVVKYIFSCDGSQYHGERVNRMYKMNNKPSCMPLVSDLKYKVKDISLAREGHKDIQLS